VAGFAPPRPERSDPNGVHSGDQKLPSILRAVRQPTALKMATEVELGKFLIYASAERQCRNVLVENEKRLAASHCDEPSIV
jgi:hypothetical protein